MKVQELNFPRPADLQAVSPPEARGLKRDEVKLLVSTAQGHRVSRFLDLPDVLRPGDLLIVNRSATLPASLPAEGPFGPFILNLSTRYGRGLWLAEPRWSPSAPGPLPFSPGLTFSAAGLNARALGVYPGLPRLYFVQFQGDVEAAMQRHGEPIRYGYLEKPYGLEHYQTVFAEAPGSLELVSEQSENPFASASAEMPSAGRPFSERVLDSLRQKGVELAKVTLHAGVSSLELEGEDVSAAALYPEPFAVPRETALAVNAARAQGRCVIAVGTTVVKALESAWDGTKIRPAQGFTRRFLHPGRPITSVDGLLTGLHDPKASHLALLYALAGPDLIREGYAEAVRHKLLWHEFGDSHLILPT